MEGLKEQAMENAYEMLATNQLWWQEMIENFLSFKMLNFEIEYVSLKTATRHDIISQ